MKNAFSYMWDVTVIFENQTLQICIFPVPVQVNSYLKITKG